MCWSFELWLYFFKYVSGYFAFHVCARCPYRPEEEGTGQRYTQFWATMWVSGIKPRASRRAANVLNYAISPGPTLVFLATESEFITPRIQGGHCAHQHNKDDPKTSPFSSTSGYPLTLKMRKIIPSKPHKCVRARCLLYIKLVALPPY